MREKVTSVNDGGPMELSEEVVDEFMENVPMSVRLAKFRTKSSKSGYRDGSFSLSLRAWDKSWAVKAHSLWNLTVQRKFDDTMKSLFKKKYMDWKEALAIKRAEKAKKLGLPKL